LLIEYDSRTYEACYNVENPTNVWLLPVVIRPLDPGGSRVRHAVGDGQERLDLGIAGERFIGFPRGKNRDVMIVGNTWIS